MITVSSLVLIFLLNVQAWTDYRLKWNESEYGNVVYVDMHSSDMWKPDLLLNNK